MNRGKQWDNILNECVERLLRGETVEQCLESYPEHAAELEPLLRTVLVVNRAADIRPDPGFKARARYQFRTVLEGVRPKRSPWLIWQPRWAVALVVFLAVLLAGSGTVVAADSSMPGNPLYPVKLATEEFRVRLATSDIDKASLLATLVDRRIAEIAYLVDRGEDGRVALVAQRLKLHLARLNSLRLVSRGEVEPKEEPAPVPQPEKEAAGITEQTGEGLLSAARAEAVQRARLRVLLGRYAATHPAQLRALLERAPEEAKPALRRAIAISMASYRQALRNLERAPD